jgi:two-component system LytT family response regulator
MSELERDLAAEEFCRIHRSAIVNLNRVRSLRLSEDGEYEVVLESGNSLRMSRSYRKQLQARLGVREPD